MNYLEEANIRIEQFFITHPAYFNYRTLFEKYINNDDKFSICGKINYVDDFILGLVVESIFNDIMKSNKTILKRTTPNENYFQHIDFRLSNKTIDCKNWKGINNDDPIPNTDILTIEIENNGIEGWLYSEHTDYFAFRIDIEEFFLIKRIDLINYYKANKNQYYHRRLNRKSKSLLAYIILEDVKNLGQTFKYKK